MPDRFADFLICRVQDAAFVVFMLAFLRVVAGLVIAIGG